MLRSLLAFGLALSVAQPADFTACIPIDNGPIKSQKPEKPFQRKPDVAAEMPTTGYGTMVSDDWPPRRWQGTGTTTVIFVPDQDTMDAICGKATMPGKVMEGCSNPARIVLPNPCVFKRHEKFAKIACHENAHHFGNWPGNHPK